jgi:hypothetical protein
MATNEALYLVQAQMRNELQNLIGYKLHGLCFFVDSKHFQFWPSFSDCILLCRVLQSFVQQMSWKLTSRALGELQHFLN